MMRQIMMLTVAVLACHAAVCLEPALTTGLAVHVDEVVGTTTIDSVDVELRRATGADVLKLAQRVELKWRGQGSDIRSLHDDTWQLRSRLHHGFSEVVQWRVVAGKPELLWSRLAVNRAASLSKVASIELPPQCTWGRTVAGSERTGEFFQRTAYCSLPTAGLVSQLHAHLEVRGWKVRSADAHGMLLARGNTTALLSISAAQASDSSWLVWLTVDPPRRHDP